MTRALKKLLGNVPAAASLYDAVRPRRPKTRYNLEQLAAYLPSGVEQTRSFAAQATPGAKLMLFASLHYWIEQAAILGLALRGLGYDVIIAYLPYSSWDREINAFDLQRQELYTRRVLAPLGELLRAHSLLEGGFTDGVPAELESAVETQSAYDVMYSLQVEDFDRGSPLYLLRLQRNRFAGGAALDILNRERPDAVLIPNGSVTELGLFYQAARYLNLKTMTYEFNDQREQIWIAQDDIVMRQNTAGLWGARCQRRLSDDERQSIADLEEARRAASTYGKGTRRWQEAAARGGEALYTALGLDERPVVLLATNVLGDSLTLGRHIFAASMAEWIARTLEYFLQRPDVQLVVRVHPGERLIKGPSMMQVVERITQGRFEHIHAVGPDEPINTYDIMDIASLGLTYTTTVGMEMAMRGVPVVVGGDTHYRQRAFTYDPSTWDDYFRMLEMILADPEGHRLTQNEIETAWNYAYRFFFEYPFVFPWRLMHLWRDIDVWPLQRVLSPEGQAAFGQTFRYLAGEPIAW